MRLGKAWNHKAKLLATNCLQRFSLKSGIHSDCNRGGSLRLNGIIKIFTVISSRVPGRSADHLTRSAGHDMTLAPYSLMKYALLAVGVVAVILLIPITIACVWFIAAAFTIAPAVGDLADSTAHVLRDTSEGMQDLKSAPKNISQTISDAWKQAREQAEKEQQAKEQAAADAEHVVTRDGYMAWDDWGHHFEAKDVGDKTELWVDGAFQARFP